VYQLLIPYDGGSIAAWQGDRMRNFPGTFVGADYNNPTGPFEITNTAIISLGGGLNAMKIYNFNPSLVVPTGIDNAPAGISALVCISY
jgi:hypothetical protein